MLDCPDDCQPVGDRILREAQKTVVSLGVV